MVITSSVEGFDLPAAGRSLVPRDMYIIAHIDLGVNIQVAQKSDLCFDIGLGVKMEVKMYGQF